MRAYTAAVITLSDKGACGQRRDESGAAVEQALKAAGYEVRQRLLLNDDRQGLTQALGRLCDAGGIDLILTTGGTGFSVRDNTPEATRDAIEREAPGIAEAMRMHSRTITPRGILSRGVSGIRGRTLIVNLPGSPRAARESLECVLPALGHGIAVLKGEAHECAENRAEGERGG